MSVARSRALVGQATVPECAVLHPKVAYNGVITTMKSELSVCIVEMGDNTQQDPLRAVRFARLVRLPIRTNP